MIKNPLTIIGVMSGTSIDGLDICAVQFSESSFTILAAETIEYNAHWKKILSHIHSYSGRDIHYTHAAYGSFCGELIHDFIVRHRIEADYIASHGHTVYHEPHNSFTVQIGSGAHIAAKTNVATICDFRLLDVAHGGQGAPLVPIGDEHLFNAYDYCINIGGFANVSCKKDDTRIAWDICAANIVLNHLSQFHGKDYDVEGKLGVQGSIISPLLAALDSLEFYALPSPKSLGREWVEQEIYPLLSNYDFSSLNVLRTYYEHTAKQIAAVLSCANSTALFTGGGCFNTFLMERISQLSKATIIIPSPEIIDFKEALIFAYLGYLRVCEEPNSLSSVTGASKNISGGVIWKV